ncbi:uncharacterized protein CHAB577_0618 [Chlamydia abortus]|nr:uncharacterized protein CHAB577_0618 [Chlamydia abortus]
MPSIVFLLLANQGMGHVESDDSEISGRAKIMPIREIQERVSH